MIGEQVSHYRIVEKVGAGGMGVVFKAEDIRLKRAVALKFLPPELTQDEEAKQRFMHEAQTASALDHPNICTIYEIDETPDGRLFLAMTFYDGETLKRRIERGPLGAEDAVAIAMQVAAGLAAAHEAGIVHRDVKPANIILTRRNEAKVVDFGIAKLTGQTALTRTGTTLGTVAYMAPEQISGEGADQRSDLWALGTVLYQMLTGQLPFRGETDVALMNSILNEKPQRLREVRPDLPRRLDEIIDRALHKKPEARYASAAELRDELRAVHAGFGAAPVAAAATRSRRRWLLNPRVAVPAVVALIAASLAGAWALNRNRNMRWARGEALPEIERLIEQDNYVAAAGLARRVEPLLAEDPALASLWERMSRTVPVKTTPAGAAISLRDVMLRTDWEYVGATPMEGARLPRGVVRWKAEKPGFDTIEFIVRPEALPASLELSPSGSIPATMVRIPAGNLQLFLTGYDYNPTIPSAEYLIDKYEATNAEFKEFIDNGGYQKREYWKHEFVKDGRVVPWEAAIAEFRDQTGRPGPSAWEVGTYPKGQDNHPVGGVSWYEAAAYAEFRGKSLPTVYHWTRAAGVELAAYITPLSNFDRKGPAPVGRNPAVTPLGLYDVAGNVREWCWNELKPRHTRYILGGGWNDPDYMFLFADARSPFDRSATNGFRCVKYLEADGLPAATLPVAPPLRSYRDAKPVSDEVFRVYQSLYAYDAAPLDARVERVDDSSGLWRRERVSFTASYGAERVSAYLFLPRKASAPYQTVLFWPGSTVLRTRSSDPLGQIEVIDFLVASGRAVLYPVYFGTYERSDGRQSTWPEVNRAYRDWVMKQVADARRSIDYLEARQDVRSEALGYYGFSWGARMGPIVLAVDPRLRAAVLLAGGFSAGDAPPEVDPFNFASHVAVPTLMVNGDTDFIYDIEQAQKPLFGLLGGATDRKKHVILTGGHGIIFEKRSQVIREVLDWFDRYLGAVR